ncbi:hypothetical protein BJV74DRAFT_779394 [Russula compacta]|nr:hypothetical protein BJV74DRAFT_779394 [Russula compacta]
MFYPEGAAAYFARLLRVDARSLRPTVSHEWPHAFFITGHAVNAPPSLFINGVPAWLLDYAIRQVGTIVPQRIWSPSDPQRYVNVSLNMPIFFAHRDRVNLGLPLLTAAAGHCATLLGAGTTTPVGDCSTMYIRMNWPGYSEWSTQIMTKDQTPAHNTIPLEKFAKRVASAVSRFMDDAQRLQGHDPNWWIGNGGITKDQVILIGAVHVSQGSWQPILQLNRYVMPRYSHGSR